MAFRGRRAEYMVRFPRPERQRDLIPVYIRAYSSRPFSFILQAIKPDFFIR
ncbi:hypothetical protein TBC1_111773 [Lentimicrobium saccharophilum]|uniref:Uncharacterized protein n=1 Tax=Lentimicrobium saccharophilum TaxID=1678841 RepID=A0A0S7C0T5_9BACT|nr:hypothetical protein TBC1_111773 [Lentimicrobium saccharophilum]